MSTATLPIILGVFGLLAAAFVYSLVKKSTRCQRQSV